MFSLDKKVSIFGEIGFFCDVGFVEIGENVELNLMKGRKIDLA